MTTRLGATAPTTELALGAIRAYQRFLSPIKGFRCAHAAYHGGPSCSHAVARIVREHGMRGAWPRIAARFAACRDAHDHLRALTRQVGASAVGDLRAQGVCCCGPIPIPFRCG